MLGEIAYRLVCKKIQNKFIMYVILSKLFFNKFYKL